MGVDHNLRSLDFQEHVADQETPVFEHLKGGSCVPEDYAHLCWQLPPGDKGGRELENTCSLPPGCYYGEPVCWEQRLSLIKSRFYLLRFVGLLRQIASVGCMEEKEGQGLPVPSDGVFLDFNDVENKVILSTTVFLFFF